MLPNKDILYIKVILIQTETYYLNSHSFQDVAENILTFKKLETNWKKIIYIYIFFNNSLYYSFITINMFS